MKVIMLATLLCSICVLPAKPQATTSATSTTQARYTHAKLCSLINSAKNSAEYAVLRDYFSHVAELKSARAAEEKQEWDRRKAYPPRKYPSPVDSAHYLYDSYIQEAQEATVKARHYEQLAQTPTTTN